MERYEDSMESKKVIPDLLMMGVIICAFFAGFLYGEISFGTEQKEYYEEYINMNCICKSIQPLENRMIIANITSVLK